MSPNAQLSLLKRSGRAFTFLVGWNTASSHPTLSSVSLSPPFKSLDTSPSLGQSATSPIFTSSFMNYKKVGAVEAGAKWNMALRTASEVKAAPPETRRFSQEQVSQRRFGASPRIRSYFIHCHFPRFSSETIRLVLPKCWGQFQYRRTLRQSLKTKL